MKKQKLSAAICLLALSCVVTAFMVAPAADTERKVIITTDLGIMKIRLYNETPLHRDNFLKLAEDKYFDSLLFHRVIQGFMVQSGDPDSKHAIQQQELGNGGPAYTVPAEFHPALYHRRGVLAAARDSDWDNPTQASSASQFYIVQGKVHTDSSLQFMAGQVTRRKLMNVLMNKRENQHLLKKYNQFVKAHQNDSIKALQGQLKAMTEKELPKVAQHTFSSEQIEAYKTAGGTPQLDQNYTVFGEVFEGLDVIDRIAAVECGPNDRPKQDVRIISIRIMK